MVRERSWLKYKRKKERKDIEPLKQVPDYHERMRRGAASKQAAINVNRIYFVDKDYEKLLVSANEVQEGGKPTRFTGQLPYIPEPDDILSTEDFKRKFKVVGRHMIPSLSINIPPKIYIILEEI